MAFHLLSSHSWRVFDFNCLIYPFSTQHAQTITRIFSMKDVNAKIPLIYVFISNFILPIQDGYVALKSILTFPFFTNFFFSSLLLNGQRSNSTHRRRPNYNFIFLLWMFTFYRTLISITSSSHTLSYLPRLLQFLHSPHKN